MKKNLHPVIVLLIVLISSCKTAPIPVSPPENVPAAGSDTEQTLPDNPETPPAIPSASGTVSDEDTIVAQFDTVTITKQTFKITKTEIQVVVEDLNKITFSKNYDRWLTYLTDEYRQNFSDPVTLEKVSASLPVKGIQLKTLKDYFTFVFVPSRQNMRVDDIQFVSPTRVYVIMEIAPKSPAAIYILEKTGDGWKLVLKNQ